MNQKDWLKIYNDERDKAVKTLDVQTFKEFYQKWKKRGFCRLPLPNDKVIEVSMYKMLFHINSATEQEKTNAKEWLESRGFTTDLE